jgi:peptidyl-tRNA hydrolase, PTH1 family
MVLTALKRLFGRTGRPDPLAALAAKDPERIRLIVGLGNPGPHYAGTRHNVGFRCVEGLAERLGATWADDRARTASRVAVAVARGTPIVLAEPQTFMNVSGAAAEKLLKVLHLNPARLLVVYDDMDLPLGSVRLRERGSAGTHNGMRSVVATLGTERFPRLRIGVGQAEDRGGREHVLSPFAPDERALADAAVERAVEAALTWATDGAAAAMNRYNS